MKKPNIQILNRSQVTEVTTRRQISYDIELDGVEYTRHENISSTMDYMGLGTVTNKSKVTWRIKEGERTYRNLYKKEVIELKLEESFKSLLVFDMNSYNGNNRIWETYKKSNN